MSLGVRALVLAMTPALGFKVSRALQLGGVRAWVAGPSTLASLRHLPCCDGFVPLRQLRAEGRDRVDPVVIDELRLVCAQRAVDIVVPAGLASATLLAGHGMRLGVRTFPLASTQLLDELHDKWTFSRRVESLGLPQPRTVLIRRPDEAVSITGFPVLTKARSLSNGEGIVAHASRRGLEAWLRARPDDAPAVVLQQFIEGRDVGVTVLADHGRLVAASAFFHRGRFQRTFIDDPELLDAAERLVAATGFHGVGHLDAIAERSRKRFHLLEFNPRFAGSLLYAVRSGVNFATLGVRAALGVRPPSRCASAPGTVTLPWSDRLLGGMVTVEGRLRTLLRRRASKSMPALSVAEPLSLRVEHPAG